MKVLTYETEILGTTEINLYKAINFKSVSFDGDMIVLPIITTPSLICDLGSVIDKAANEYDIPWVNCEMTKFSLYVDPSANDFNCSLNATIFPQQFSLEEEKEYLKIYSADDIEARELFKHFCNKTNKLYNDSAWEVEGYSENSFDIELEAVETNQLLWIIIQHLFNEAYYSETVKAVPVSA